MDRVTVMVAGKIYDGWKSVRLTRHLDALCGSFTLSTFDDFPLRALADTPAATIAVGGEIVLTGYLEKARRGELDGAVEVSGRDKTCDLVDSSAEPTEYRGQTIFDLVRALAAPFGIPVTPVMIPMAPVGLWRVEPGETVFQALERLCRRFGFLLRTNGLGHLVIEPVGIVRSETELIQGQNVMDAAVSLDKDQLFSSYTATGDGDNWLKPALTATIEDMSVKRHRPLRIVAESAASQEDLKTRVEWERAVRRGRSLSVIIKTHGWRRPSGRLWQVNETVPVIIPRLGLKHDLLVSGVEFSFGEDGTLTTLDLTYGDAFAVKPAGDRKRGLLQW